MGAGAGRLEKRSLTDLVRFAGRFEDVERHDLLYKKWHGRNVQCAARDLTDMLLARMGAVPHAEADECSSSVDKKRWETYLTYRPIASNTRVVCRHIWCNINAPPALAPRFCPKAGVVAGIPPIRPAHLVQCISWTPNIDKD